jgi:hypothetical protein
MRSTRRVFTCGRAGKYNSKGKDLNTHSSKQRQNTGSKECGCPMKVVLRLHQISSTWSLKVLEAAHNHDPSRASTAHSVHRIPALALSGRTTISTLSRAGLLPSQILNTLRVLEPDVPLILKDIYNFTQKAKLKELDRKTPIQWLLDVRYLPFLPLSTYTDLYRSFQATTSTLDISLKVDLSSDLPLYIRPPLYSRSRIPISYSLITPIRPTGLTCHS